jgi:hypothetical protein
MTVLTLLLSIGLLITIFIVFVWIYDRKLVKEITRHEKKLEKKGIYKRHFTKPNEPKV